MKKVTCTLYSTCMMHHDMPCDPSLVSSVFYTIPVYSLSKLQIFSFTCRSISGMPMADNTYQPIIGGLHYEIRAPCFRKALWMYHSA